MATSPIYGWLEPDNTDLVKNGALAIRTLGNAIDTTMGTMTPKSIVDAKGDLIAASANDTPARLAVGANGETLVADSSTATGLRYQGHIEAGKNFIINGGMDIWQRGTSFASAGSLGIYGADRWVYFRGSGATGGTFSRQASGLTGFQYSQRVQRNSGDTSTQYLGLFYSGETADSIKFAGQTITVSFYAKAGANYSSTSNLLRAIVNSGTGTDQPNWAYTGGVSVIDQSATLTTSWQRFSYSGTVASNATEIGLTILNTPTGTAGANDWYEVTGIQIELGSVATTFSRAGGTIQGELAACQRYYWRQTASGANNCFINAGKTSSSTAVNLFLALPVTMRITPTVLDYSGGAIDDTSTSYGFTALVIGAGGSGPNTVQLNATVTSTTSGRYATLRANAGSDFLGLGAEL